MEPKLAHWLQPTAATSHDNFDVFFFVQVITDRSGMFDAGEEERAGAEWS